MKRVAAVMVVYNPDLELLKRNLQAIAGQVERVYIIDNTPDGDLSEWDGLPENCLYIPLKENLGIAAAQNLGIKKAVEQRSEYIYFLDQDSHSPSNIIEQLLRHLNSFEKKGINIGGIGALPINFYTDKPYITLPKHSIEEKDVAEVSEIISSGSLVPSSVFNEVGGMMEKLFIDGVDHEFCWRAKAVAGYRFFIAKDIQLHHQLGIGDKRMLWWKVAIPSPFRTYYLYRNIFLLSKLPYVPLGFKVKNAVKLVAKIFYYPLFISPRREYAANIFRGIRDGFKSLRRK